MQATMEDIRQNIDPDEEILACIRCSIRIFIYRLQYRPGLLAATNHKLIFVGDSVVGDSLVEEYRYDDIEDFTRKKRWFSHMLILQEKTEIIKFGRMTSGSVDILIETVQNRIH